MDDGTMEAISRITAGNGKTFMPGGERTKRMRTGRAAFQGTRGVILKQGGLYE
jgi:hypothetical protein